jgi:hypothetical protein
LIGFCEIERTVPICFQGQPFFFFEKKRTCTTGFQQVLLVKPVVPVFLVLSPCSALLAHRSASEIPSSTGRRPDPVTGTQQGTPQRVASAANPSTAQTRFRDFLSDSLPRLAQQFFLSFRRRGRRRLILPLLRWLPRRYCLCRLPPVRFGHLGLLFGI